MPLDGTAAGFTKSILAEVARNDAAVVAAVPDWIVLFEDTANREIRSRYAIKTTTLTANTSSPTPQVIPLPSDYNETFVSYNQALNPPPSGYPAGPFLYPFEIKTPVQSVNDPNFYLLGMPFSYTIIGTNVVLGKTPDANYSFGFNYYAQVAGLASNPSGNWLLFYYPSLYLYGTLVHSAPFLGEDQRLQTWGALYQAALKSQQKTERDSRFSGNILRVIGL